MQSATRHRTWHSYSQVSRLVCFGLRWLALACIELLQVASSALSVRLSGIQDMPDTALCIYLVLERGSEGVKG